jgi:hypothetical protein
MPFSARPWVVGESGNRHLMTRLLSLRVWLTDENSDEPAAIAEKRKLLKPTQDTQSGKLYLSFWDHDGFRIAKLIPGAVVELVTAKQHTQSVHPAHAHPGTYIHGDVEIIIEHDDYAFHSVMGPRSLQVYLIGKSVGEVQEAYSDPSGGRKISDSRNERSGTHGVLAGIVRAGGRGRFCCHVSGSGPWSNPRRN